jgi:hypothetical protein
LREAHLARGLENCVEYLTLKKVLGGATETVCDFSPKSNQRTRKLESTLDP